MMKKATRPGEPLAASTVPRAPQDAERGGGCDAPERPPGDVRHGRAWRLGDEPPEEERGQERREGEYEEDAPPRHELAQDTGQQQAEGRPEARSREQDALPHRHLLLG